MNFLKQMTIKQKLIVVIIITNTISLLVASILFITSEILDSKQDIVKDARSLLEMISLNNSIPLLFDDHPTATENLSRLSVKSSVMMVKLFEPNGDVFAEYHNPTFTKLDHPLLTDSNFQLWSDYFSLQRPILFDGDNIGNVLIQMDLTHVHQRIYWYIKMVLLIILCALLSAFIIGAKLQQLITQPIYDLYQIISSMGTNEYCEQPNNTENNDELMALVYGFHQMLIKLHNYQENLSELVEKRTVQLALARDEALAANQAKSTFLANMSHEIRTPLNAVLGYTQILLQEHNLTNQQRQFVETIGKSGRHLLALINDILDISKIEAGVIELNPSHFKLNDVMLEINVLFKLRCEQKDLIWEMESNLPESTWVYADQNKLRQIFINLLGNAVKFTATGKISFIIEKMQNQYVFAVKDTGIGISTEDQQRIFQPFQQVSNDLGKGGTGLGLAITAKQIELMAGTITVESQLGQGCYFTVCMALPQGDATQIKIDDQQVVLRLLPDYQVTALVADDKVENRDILKNLLERIGVVVVTANNGEQAVDASNQQVFDIVFMDIRMPVMDGIEAMQLIRQQADQMMKYVAISASSLNHQKQQFLAIGFDAFIPKPFNFQEIYDCMMQLLDIEYQYQSHAPVLEKVADLQIDLKSIQLADVDYQRLQQATELAQVVKIRAILSELKAQNPSLNDFVNKVEYYLKSYDMDKILALLNELPKH